MERTSRRRVSRRLATLTASLALCIATACKGADPPREPPLANERPSAVANANVVRRGAVAERSDGVLRLEMQHLDDAAKPPLERAASVIAGLDRLAGQPLEVASLDRSGKVLVVHLRQRIGDLPVAGPGVALIVPDEIGAIVSGDLVLDPPDDTPTVSTTDAVASATRDGRSVVGEPTLAITPSFPGATGPRLVWQVPTNASTVLVDAATGAIWALRPLEVE